MLLLLQGNYFYTVQNAINTVQFVIEFIAKANFYTLVW